MQYYWIIWDTEKNEEYMSSLDKQRQWFFTMIYTNLQSWVWIKNSKTLNFSWSICTIFCPHVWLHNTFIWLHALKLCVWKEILKSLIPLMIIWITCLLFPYVVSHSLSWSILLEVLKCHGEYQNFSVLSFQNQ